MSYQDTDGVNFTGDTPTIAEGLALLDALPIIRETICYRGNRFEWKLTEWQYVVTQGKLFSILHNWRGAYCLTRRKASSVILALKQEGQEIKAEEMNPILVTYPEHTDEVRKVHMPRVRQFFKFEKNSFYERSVRDGSV